MTARGVHRFRYRLVRESSLDAVKLKGHHWCLLHCGHGCCCGSRLIVERVDARQGVLWLMRHDMPVSIICAAVSAQSFWCVVTWKVGGVWYFEVEAVVCVVADNSWTGQRCSSLQSVLACFT